MEQDKIKSEKAIQKKMPDISGESLALHNYPLEKVGMSSIEMPVKIAILNDINTLPAKIEAYVSLDQASAKGIHMSRVYLQLKESLEREVLSLKTLKGLLRQFVQSQGGLSHSSFLKIDFELPVKRKALLSDETGWRQYPISLSAQLDNGEFQFVFATEVAYSSTCPCSAALSRQLLQEKFLQDYKGEENIDFEEILGWLGKESSITATPHAQRSYARVKLSLDPEAIAPEPLEIINNIEKALKTPVQTAVKRQDEQEFARLNAQNLMFCEDAARRIKAYFESDKRFIDYYGQVEHQESLHPHSATASFVKGVNNGFKA